MRKIRNYSDKTERNILSDIKKIVRDYRNEEIDSLFDYEKKEKSKRRSFRY